MIDQLQKKYKTQSSPFLVQLSPWGGNPGAWFTPGPVINYFTTLWSSLRSIEDIGASVIWRWAFHAPLQDAAATASRRKEKLRANQGRLEFMSLCIESWGDFDFLERLADRHELFWFGGKQRKGSAEVRNLSGVPTEDLSSVFRRDPTRYRFTIEHALDPVRIDDYGYLCECVHLYLVVVIPSGRVIAMSSSISSYAPSVNVMSPSQASSDDFPRLIGADNFDVWKARVCAALDGKHLLGFVIKPDYDGVSEDESEDSGSDMSDTDDPPKITPAKTAEIDSDAVDYDESDDDLKPASGSDEDSNDGSDTV
ncbi:Hypothetical protein PHPALM_18533, partial [Phytophthora palmivora]